ncbi:hypothetical protein FACS1894216_22630 [Synergistales bacterium]|nr:hypothetical protein FACS1894216_22630 [Synergistales bacterium]
MIFDQKLCFIDGGDLTAFGGGALGEALDLGADNQLGKGRPAYLAIACDSDATATGSPNITLTLQMSDNADFSAPVSVPLPIPTLTKDDLKAGSVVASPLPLLSKRFVKLNMALQKTTGDGNPEIACSTLTAGIVLDAQTNK